VAPSLGKRPRGARLRQLGSLQWPQVSGNARVGPVCDSWGHSSGHFYPERAWNRGLEPKGVTGLATTIPNPKELRVSHA
jgi:hypothetical protein